MVDIIQMLIAGISLGSIYGLVALTFTAIYNASKIINFAQGEFLMLGAIFASILLLTLHLNYWLVLIIIIVITAIVGLVLERVVVTPLLNRRTPLVTIIIATMGVAMMIAGGTGIATRYAWMRVPAPLGIDPWWLGEVAILPQNALVIIATIILVLLYWFLLKKTMIGTALRATGFNSEMASLVGIQVSWMVAFSFIISAAMAGIAGMLVGPLTTPYYLMGLPLVVKGFVAAILGGLGNPYAAVVGGVILGVLNVWLSGYAPAYAEVGTFGILLAVLLLRPHGLFGTPE